MKRVIKLLVFLLLIGSSNCFAYNADVKQLLDQIHKLDAERQLRNQEWEITAQNELLKLAGSTVFYKMRLADYNTRSALGKLSNLEPVKINAVDMQQKTLVLQKDNGEVINWKYDRNSTELQYFSWKNSIDLTFAKNIDALSEHEIALIKKGRTQLGMSCLAVMYALGLPTSSSQSMNDSFTLDIYYYSGSTGMSVYTFKDKQLVSIDRVE